MDKLFQTEIIDYIKQSKGAETAALQKKFGISYKDAKLIVSELLSNGDLVYVGGVKYSYVAPQCNEPVGEVATDNTPHNSEGISAAARRLARLQARRNELFGDARSEPDEETDSLFADIDEFDLEEDDLDEDFEEQSQKLEDMVNRALDKHAPILPHVMPSHDLWPDDGEFIDAVMNRLDRLIKSDLKMGQQSAVKKAEAYLEGVRDTDDYPMIQVYERLVYELKNISPHLYRQLKKRFCED